MSSRGDVPAGGSSWTPEWLKFDNSYFTHVENEDDPELLVLPTDKAVFVDDDMRSAPVSRTTTVHMAHITSMSHCSGPRDIPVLLRSRV